MELCHLVVFLDAGHGIGTRGKQSPDGTLREYESNRRIVAEIESLLDRVHVAHVRTVNDDVDLPLSARADVANGYLFRARMVDPDVRGVFVSVHSDASGDGTMWMPARGWSVWTTRGQNNSDRLADAIYAAAERLLKPAGIVLRPDRRDGDNDQESDFTVIFKAEMPAVLTENLFHDNREDVALLKDERTVRLLARVHAEGILDFAKMLH